MIGLNRGILLSIDVKADRVPVEPVFLLHPTLPEGEIDDNMRNLFPVESMLAVLVGVLDFPFKVLVLGLEVAVLLLHVAVDFGDLASRILLEDLLGWPG